MDYKELKLNRFLQRDSGQNEETKDAVFNSLNPVDKRGQEPGYKKGRVPDNSEDDGAPNILTGTVIIACFIQTSALPSRIELSGNDLTFYDDTYTEFGEVVGDTSRMVFTHDMNSEEGFIMEKRASSLDTYDNVLSWYATEAKQGRDNYLFIGRDGRGDRPETRNLGSFEMSVNATLAKGLGQANGRISMRGYLDQQPTLTQVSMNWLGSIINGATGYGANVFGSGDTSSSDMGYAALAYYNDTTGNAVNGIQCSKAGVQAFGLPTSPAGLPVGALWIDGTVINIVV